ncbi:heavy metal translocating P-type ATPase [Stagnihabitans tardus]|uniref:heavy metal translocating P-type ATPase n=1 Tax=Stagnihabitans tardus TaxID=2699202 RepID=UPI001D101CF5|nr:heavy metal translocating P-type ATPase [Stagnihabitans tardus]
MSKTFPQIALFLLALCGLLAGLALWATDNPLAPQVWTAATLPVLAVLAWEILRSLIKGDFGLDILAALSMSAALATGEPLAAVVVAVMYAGGGLLEAFAETRARSEMTALLSKVPRRAHRHRDGLLEEVALAEIAPGDRLLIRQGDTVPVDGRVESPLAVLDTSTLTGEPLPRQATQGEEVLSGMVNAAEAFDMLAQRRAEESTFAGILRLVEAAQGSKAPMARMADRWALAFLAVTLAIAGAAWALTGETQRAVAVLVVATPCPLILAVPVALVAGLSRAAQFGVLVKSAGGLEAMAQVRCLVLDKTGTLTEGRPQVRAVHVADGGDPERVLALAAALDQASGHPVARALVAEARARGLDLPLPEGVEEQPGEGLSGRIEGQAVLVGGEAFVAGRTGRALAMAGVEPGAVTVCVAVEGRPVGRIILTDPLRPGTAGLLRRLRGMGLRRILLATGDRAEVAEAVTRDLGLDAVRADLGPGDKLALVREEQRRGPVMMVGDGVNDAPALASAEVGVAMGARGAAASAEAADVVLLVDRLEALAQGVTVAKGARAIALQSVMAGIGLSLAGQVAAGFGLLSPVQGALVQEAIDVAVILNALRVLRVGR